MDNRTKIFNNSKYNLPIRWDGGDFYLSVYNHLKEYQADINKYFQHDDQLQNDVNKVCLAIRLTLNEYLKGLPSEAYRRLSEILESFSEMYPLTIDPKFVHNEKLYRVVNAGDRAEKSRKRIFHPPFNVRNKIATQRYCIPGFPTLYLGTSLENCLEEVESCGQRDTMIASRFELQIEARRKNRESLVFDDDKFKIIDFSAKPQHYILSKTVSSTLPDILTYLRWYPIIAVCSYIRVNRYDPYAPEYSIPQIVTQWIRSSAMNSIAGIRYFSCASEKRSERGCNYAFPTRGIPNLVCKTIVDYCPCLVHRFKLTAPVFVHEFDTVGECKDMIDKSPLDYIISNRDEFNIMRSKKTISKKDIPDGVCEIGQFVFSRCDRLKSVNLPNSIISIGDSAFDGCSELVRVGIPDGVERIGGWSFFNCGHLSEIKLPSKIKRIGNWTFYRCSRLTRVNIPNSVISIGEGAFAGCTSLLELKIPDTVLHIGNRAFVGCSKITKVSIPKGVKKIESSTFSHCEKLEEVRVSDGIIDIGSSAFASCSSLTKITLPDGVKNIGELAFFRCCQLPEMVIPGSVEKIGEGAFGGCKQLSLGNVRVNDSNTHFKIVDNCLIDVDNGTVLFGNDKSVIADKPEIRRIGNSAFTDCTELVEVFIPNSVTSIGNWAFANCNKLTRLKLPDNITEVGEGAFSGCNQVSIEISEESKLYGIIRTIDDCLVDLKRHTVLLGKRNFVIPQGQKIERIGKGAFAHCISLSEIDIIDGITSIGEYAFYNCVDLEKVQLPNSLEKIEERAFSGCSRLTELNIPSSIKSIGRGAFSNCEKLGKITIDNPDVKLDAVFDTCEYQVEITGEDNEKMVLRKLCT